MTARLEIHVESIGRKGLFMERCEQTCLRMHFSVFPMKVLSNYFVLTHEESPDQSPVTDFSSTVFSKTQAYTNTLSVI